MGTPSTFDSPHYVACTDALDFMAKVQGRSRRYWIYRGHSISSLKSNDEWSTSEWRLESSLLRYLRTHKVKFTANRQYRREKAALERFQQVAPLYLAHLPDDDDALNWLALMQHYGSPTRLLDFTFNPAVALFFALRGVIPNGAPWCVHALKIEAVRGRSYYKRMNAAKGKTVSPSPRVSEYQIGERPPKHDFVGIVDTRLTSARQAAQEGLFLAPSRVDLDVETWLRGINAPESGLLKYPNWVKFVFQNNEDSYYSTVKQLMQMGMSPVRLFPGLDGLCESFRYTWLDPSKNYPPGEEPDET